MGMRKNQQKSIKIYRHVLKFIDMYRCIKNYRSVLELKQSVETD